jgi:hypothetical protein
MFYETGKGGRLPKEQLAKISRVLTALGSFLLLSHPMFSMLIIWITTK